MYMIPKTIHYCWFGGNPKPKSVIRCIKSWRKKCPGYEIIEWNESNYDVTQTRYMKEAYDEKKWGFVPDCARLDIIFRYGGIYLDTDVELIRTLDPFLNCRSFCSFQFDNLIALGLGFGAEPGNELVKKLLDFYHSHSFYNEDGSVNLTPSPEINAQVFLDYGFELNGNYQDVGGNIIYPREYFDPKDFRSGFIRKTKKTVSIHHYDASWFDEWKQKEKLAKWRRHRISYIKKTPNRLLMKLLGNTRYEDLKRIIKKNRTT